MAKHKRIAAIALKIAEWAGVILFALIGLVLVVAAVVLAWVGKAPERMGEGPPPARVEAPPPEAVAATHRAPPPASADESASLFAPVYQVLVSPRCMNCHPKGDRPLSDREGAHAMNISRTSFEAGLRCDTCHAEHNTELPGAPAGPPGAPHWQLPPREAPMPFQDRTITALCKQLRDPAQNGERSLEDLVEHVSSDPLVLWGWKPGGERSIPPLSHADFVAAFETWVAAGGICPGEREAPALGGEADNTGETREEIPVDPPAPKHAP